MEYLHVVRKTDLARNTRQVMKAVQRGQTVIVEEHGQPEAAIVDITDFYLQRAALRYLTAPNSEQTLPEITPAALAALPDDQARFDRVLAYYLGVQISLERAGELLEMNFYDLQTRLARLGVPMRSGPTTLNELRAELEAVDRWEAEG